MRSICRPVYADPWPRRVVRALTWVGCTRGPGQMALASPAARALNTAIIAWYWGGRKLINHRSMVQWACAGARGANAFWCGTVSLEYAIFAMVDLNTWNKRNINLDAFPSGLVSPMRCISMFKCCSLSTRHKSGPHSGLYTEQVVYRVGKEVQCLVMEV